MIFVPDLHFCLSVHTVCETSSTPVLTQFSIIIIQTLTNVAVLILKKASSLHSEIRRRRFQYATKMFKKI